MRPTVLRRALALSGAALIISTNTVFADTTSVDGDTATVGNNISYVDSPNLVTSGSNAGLYTGEACSTRGSAVAGLVTVTRSNSGSHFNAGAAVTLTVTPTAGAVAQGITATGNTVSVPSGTSWDSNGDVFTAAISTTTPTTAANGGPYTINYSVSGPGTGTANVVNGVYTITGSYTVAVDCTVATNTPPTVAFDASQPSTAVEGDTKAFSFTITDTQGGAMTYAAGYPDCGSGNTVSAPLISATGGSFDCTFVDGLVPAVNSAVKVKVVDSGNLASNEASTSVTVSNANPVVAAPSFSNTSINCGSSVNLTGISFSDAGTIDYPWAVNINWGDGSTDTSYNTNTQGSQSSQSHTFSTPGTFAATVGVTDKDSGYGSNTSSNTVTVNQYAVTFLAPFDGSSPSNLITNTMKSGRVVPVKAVIYDYCSGTYVTDPAAVVKIVVKATTIGSLADNDAVEIYADAGASNSNTLQFRWSADSTAPGGGFWIYNLDSKTAIGGSAMVVNTTYRVDVFVGSARATGTTWALLKPVK